MSINQLTIVQAIEGLKSKQFSSVELTQACLNRIEQANPQINAFITVTKDNALKQAEKADKQLSNAAIEQYPLLGIPIALKDIFSTKGIETTAGSNVLKGYVPPSDATVVKKLKDAGAVIIGKTNLDAWAHGSSGENSDFGPTKNPYNKQYVPGGSSSGSAAAVASDMCLAATGTDTGGSIRLPASFTNTVGLKPTYGRVSRYGVIAMASSMDSIGHFTKTVEDSALILQVTAGNDPMDATTPKKDVLKYMSSLRNGIKGIKIGAYKWLKHEKQELRTIPLYENTLKQLHDLGAEIVPIDLPHEQYAIATYYIIQPAEVSSNLARYDGIRFGGNRSNFGDEAKRRIMLGTYTLSAGYYDAYYKKAMQVRTLIAEDFKKVFEQVDAIVMPVSPTPPWKLGEKVNDPLEMYFSDIFTVTANLAGLPGLSVPMGFINGLPVGMQILGPHFSEDLLFQIGHVYEETTKNESWRQIKPEL